MKRGAVTAAFIALLLYPLLISAAEQRTTVSTAPRMKSIDQDSTAWRRDPFIVSGKKQTSAAAPDAARHSLTAPTLRAEQINLQGILRSDKHFLALINGQIVKTGDRIGSVTIKQINRYQVVVLNENKERIIYDIYQGRIDRGKR